MTLHKEGNATIGITAVALVIINAVVFYYAKGLPLVYGLVMFLSFDVFLLVVNFFRDPQLPVTQDGNLLLSPCDGKIVVIEETEEPEYFKDKRLQISIFMSPLNVHINYYPTSGIVKYFKYHKGKYLVAWHPKSSTENERTTVVVQKSGTDKEVLVRQIAGSVARRVVCYSKTGDTAAQGSQMGFIKFGSRMDVFLPLGTEVKVKIDDKVTGSQTPIAVF